jgi:hypothetical protein
MDSSGIGQYLVTYSWEYANEISGSIKGRELID